MAVTMSLSQSGSAATVIHAATGDTITLKMKNVNHASQIAEAGAHLQALAQITGVAFVIDATGGAS